MPMERILINWAWLCIASCQMWQWETIDTVSSSFLTRWLLESDMQLNRKWSELGFPDYTESNHMCLMVLPLSSWEFNFTIHFPFFLF